MEETIKSSSSSSSKMNPQPQFSPDSLSAIASLSSEALAKEGATADGLRVKELAESLAVSMRFVYQMRARGFPMRGNEPHSQTATVQEARDWIKANNFRLVKGVGVIGNVCG